jgi:hypothetical protein
VKALKSDKLFLLALNLSLLFLFGCDVPNMKKGELITKDIKFTLFKNHGCIYEIQKNKQYCNDITATYGSGFGLVRINIVGSLTSKDEEDVLEIVKKANDKKIRLNINKKSISY